MRKIPGPKSTIAAGLIVAFGCLISQSASAETGTTANNSFQLPGVTLPQGTDEVRAADGTSCRSAVGSAGAYLDVGVIGRPTSNMEDNSYYGHVVIPIGTGPKRLDCSRLYDLEVERLKLELELAKAGLGRSVDPEVDGTQTTALPEEPAAEANPTVVANIADAPKETAASDGSTDEIVVSATPLGKPSKKVKKAQAAAKPVKLVKTKTKVGNASWADEGWSDDGLKDGG